MYRLLSNNHRCLLIGLVAIAGLSVPGCDESLPPRDEPKQVLKFSSRVIGSLVTIHGTAPLDGWGALVVEVKNTYQEVLQDSEGIDVQWNVWLKSDSTKRATIASTARDISTPWALRDNLLTIGPDSIAGVISQWSHRTDDDIPFWTFVPTGYQYTPNGVRYLESDTVEFVARGSARFFKHLQTQKVGPFEFKLYYRVFAE